MSRRSVLRLALTFMLLAVLNPMAACTHGAELLPKLGEVPAFALRDQNGRPVTRDSLRGKVWIADFIFTSCPDVCPLLTEQLAGIRKRLGTHSGKLAFVSFSVDPEHDTPERLAEFAAQHGATAPDWFFLTGPLDDVKRIVTQGFKQAMETQPQQPDKPRNVLHGTHYVLVDAHGVIRAFDRSDTEGIAELYADTEHLLADGEGPP